MSDGVEPAPFVASWLGRPGHGVEVPVAHDQKPFDLSRPADRAFTLSSFLFCARASLDATQLHPKSVLRDHFRVPHSLPQPLVGPPVHALGLLWKWRQHPRIATQPHADAVGPPKRPLMRLLPLALVGEPVAVTAKEVSAWTVELSDPPAASTPSTTPWQTNHGREPPKWHGVQTIGTGSSTSCHSSS